MRYKDWFENCFAEVEEKYNLKTLVAADNKMALIGETYILLFTVHWGEVYISYVHRQTDGQLVEELLDENFIYSVDKRDRMGIHPRPCTVREETEDEIMITSRCLARRWEDLLRGETAWMTDPERIVRPMRKRELYKEEKAFAEQYI